MHTRRLPKQFIYLLQTVVSHCKGSTQWILPLFSLCGMANQKNCWKQTTLQKRTFMKSSDSVHVWATLRNITLDLIMHCTYYFPCGLSFRFQISLSIAAMALSYSCHNINLFWLKAVGLKFVPRNDNHNVQILIWFSRPIWNKPCFTSTTFKDNGMMLLRHTVVDTSQCFSHLYL